MNEGLRLYHQKKYEHALKEFQQIAGDTDGHPELPYYMGLCYTHLSRYDEALLYLEQVVTSDLGFAYLYQSRMILGYIYAITDRYRLAEFEFTSLLEQGYESAKVYAALGYVLYAQNKVPESIGMLEKALKIDKENANALNSLGYVMAENGIRLELALRYCEKAVSRKPGNPAYLDSLGWTQYRLGKYNEARRTLREALRKSPRNREIAGHLKVVMEHIKSPAGGSS
jgi:tetratricopeptide (TPR) repeat protein